MIMNIYNPLNWQLIKEEGNERQTIWTEHPLNFVDEYQLVPEWYRTLEFIALWEHWNELSDAIAEKYKERERYTYQESFVMSIRNLISERSKYSWYLTWLEILWVDNHEQALEFVSRY